MGTDMVVPLLPRGAEVTAETTSIIEAIHDYGTPGIQIELFCLTDFMNLSKMIATFIFSSKVATAKRAVKQVFWKIYFFVFNPIAFLDERPTTPA